MTLPFRRRTDTWSSKHERARARAAERLSGPIEPAEADWLERHLTDCAPCRTVADAYERDRLALRGLRDEAPEPPRDLWARTAAAIELEASLAPAAPRPRRSIVPLGAVSGLLVVAVVFGAALLSGHPTPSVEPSGTALIALPPRPTYSPVPQPTPMTAFGRVDFVQLGVNRIAVYSESYSEVCPENGAQCAPLEPATPKTEVDMSAAPDQVIRSSDGANLIVVEGIGEGRDKILAVAVPTPTPPPTRTPTPPATGTPSTAPTESAPAPTESAPEPSAAPPETSAPPSAGQSDEPTTLASSTPPPSSPSPSPSPSAAPTPFEIANDVVLVGSPEFNADGSRLAFSTRPADGSRGPDIFVWSPGDKDATPVTTDHRSVFSGWLDQLVLGSRPVDETARVTSAEAFVVDPGTGANATVPGIAAWRPSVDPSGKRAAYWDGTIARAANGVDWQPADGRLVVGRWPGTPELSAEPEAGPTEEPSESALPDESAAPTMPLSFLPSPRVAAGLDVLVDRPVGDWIARWDELGDRLAVWVADEYDPTIGRLSLYAVNDETRRLDVDDPELRNELARPGFSIRVGQLAWATTEGQNGKGSHVKVVAWTSRGIGSVETKPANDVLIVQH